MHTAETQDIKRLRDCRVQAAGKTYLLARGEFHRHTEYTAHRDVDGSLEDMWRYALDAAGMDWLGNADHDNGYGHQYAWWTIQKTTDIYHNPPWFTAPYTYERSVNWPNGHRNVIFAERGIRPLPRGNMQGDEKTGTPDTKMLYAYLRHFQGICASHTSTTGMGTDWRDNDPLVEPVVEIYQGDRNNYECEEAPRSFTAGVLPLKGGGSPSRGIRLERAGQGLSLWFREFQRPHQHALQLRHRAGREAGAAGAAGGVPRPPLLRRHRQHSAGGQVRRAPDGRGVHFEGEAHAARPRRRDGAHRAGRNRAEQPIRVQRRAEPDNG